MARSSRKSELLDDLTDEGNGKEVMSYHELKAELPEEFRWLDGETAKQYRERIAPRFNEFLLAKAIVEGNPRAMELVANLQIKDMETKVKVAQIVGPQGAKALMVEGNADVFKEITGTIGIPAAGAGMPMRPSEMAGF